MASGSQKRLAKEYADCTKTPPTGMSIHLANESDLHKWHVTLEGPAGSVYAGGRFGLIITLPTDYPFKAPDVRFATRIYHPNVTNDNQGGICLGLLKSGNWKPSTRLLSVLEAIRGLLAEPQPDDPLEARIAHEYQNDRKEFEKNARSYVNHYAKGPVKFDVAPPNVNASGSSKDGAAPSR
ncbi:ubiquitin-conjugating enzyme/RWD-like protein [Echria macrotheca]|uniref:E2 ubiquitin-conjugating enzyme n=1 Tax=Echria macrotheca TaxID=438768 RepID=A0AAJ0F6A7_9PEZI|nr:ubiquitin-conjugating enzyme/RWD-like protein [Echria macrotheca]